MAHNLFIVWLSSRTCLQYSLAIHCLMLNNNVKTNNLTCHLKILQLEVLGFFRFKNNNSFPKLKIYLKNVRCYGLRVVSSIIKNIVTFVWERRIYGSNLLLPLSFIVNVMVRCLRVGRNSFNILSLLRYFLLLIIDQLRTQIIAYYFSMAPSIFSSGARDRTYIPTSDTIPKYLLLLIFLLTVRFVTNFFVAYSARSTLSESKRFMLASKGVLLDKWFPIC